MPQLKKYTTLHQRLASHISINKSFPLSLGACNKVDTNSLRCLKPVTFVLFLVLICLDVANACKSTN